MHQIKIFPLMLLEILYVTLSPNNLLIETKLLTKSNDVCIFIIKAYKLFDTCHRTSDNKTIQNTKRRLLHD